MRAVVTGFLVAEPLADPPDGVVERALQPG